MNCAILGRAEAYAMKNPPLLAMLDGLGMGLGFTLSMTIMGGCREIIGSGTLFSGASLLLGPHFKFMELHVLPGYHGFLLMLLPPGGFIMMGLLLCAIRLSKRAFAGKKAEVAATPATQGGCHL